MLVLLLTLAHADYDGGYTYEFNPGGSGANDCYIDARCRFCVRCTDVPCEMAQQELGKSRECVAELRNETIAVWCDCSFEPYGGQNGDDDDDDVDPNPDPDSDETDGTRDPVPTMEPDGEDAKAGGCSCSVAAVDGPAALFGMLAMLSGGLLVRRRR